MKNFFDTSPKFFTLSAFTIGFILLDELDGFEQNALGNWLMLIGQTLETSSTLLPSSAPYYGKNNTNSNKFDINTLKKVRDALDNYIKTNKI